MNPRYKILIEAFVIWGVVFAAIRWCTSINPDTEGARFFALFISTFIAGGYATFPRGRG